MQQVIKIAITCIGVLAAAGCRDRKEPDPIWEGVKISDLAPRNAGLRESPFLKTVDFDVYVFEMPAGKMDVMGEIWPLLHKEQLRFNNSEAFAANLFSAGFGQIDLWDKTADLLRKAGAKKTERTTLLLLDGQSEECTIKKINTEQAIFYAPNAGGIEGASGGPGTLSLRIKAGKIAGSRGVCDMSAVPVFWSHKTRSKARLSGQGDTGDFVFTAAGFRLRMTPGSFVLLGPEKYIEHKGTLGSLFFCGAGEKPAVRIFSIVCTGITE